MKEVEKVSFSRVKSIDKNFEEFIVSYYYKNKSLKRYIFIEKKPKYKKDTYLKLAKKEFYNDVKNGRINCGSNHKKPFIILGSSLGALAVALTIFFVHRNINVTPPPPPTPPIVVDAITFDSEGGILELYEKEKVELPYTKGTTWSAFYPENKYIGAVKSGYDFLCWSLDGKNPIPNDYVFNEPTTLKPIYVENRDCITISCRYLDDQYTTPSTDYNISFEWPKDEPGIPGHAYYAINNGIFNEYATSGEQIQGNLESAGDYFSFKTDDVMLPPIAPALPPFSSNFSIKLIDPNNKTRFAVSGPIDALTGKKDFPDLGYAGVFQTIFSGSNGLCSARGLDLDVNHPLTNQVFSRMFESDTNLLFPPILPATTLAANCYQAMFFACSSLLIAPKLPATTLTSSCYAGMFNGCSSLTATPELPATTLAENCYSEMFNGCSSLTTSPELPAIITADDKYCYQSMFRDCTSLINVPDLSSPYVGPYSYTRMFSGCTALKNAPEMFFENKSSQQSLNYMFDGCTSLKYVKIHCVDSQTFSGLSTYRWLRNVSATGDFYFNGTVPTARGADTIPAEWTVHTF